MTNYAIISDKDELYNKVVENLSSNTDYTENEIKIDIDTKMLKRGVRNDLYNVDLIIVLSRECSKVIIKLLKWGIPFQKIVTSYEVDEISKYAEVISKIYKNGVVHFSLGEEAVPWYIKMDEVNYDYVRFRTLALVIDQIKAKKLSGNCAEVGVFQGDFARWLNYCFEEKELYLFDTFEGFDDKDVLEEHQIGATEELKDVMENGFKETSVEYVLSRMKNPKKCKVFKGYFPETAVDVNDTFCFVSLDTDLYRPTREGLEFFYPRITGGVLFVHDYNSPACKGVHQAVDEWCKANSKVPIPICDKYGSCIIVKQ